MSELTKASQDIFSATMQGLEQALTVRHIAAFEVIAGNPDENAAALFARYPDNDQFPDKRDDSVIGVAERPQGIGHETIRAYMKPLADSHLIAAEQSLADFDQAIELDEERDWYCYGRSLTCLAQAQAETAASDLKQAITLAEPAYQTNPKNWRNTFNLALYQLTAGQTTEADPLYREGANAPLHILQEATDDLEDLLTVLPRHEQAIEMRDYLRQVIVERQTGEEALAPARPNASPPSPENDQE
jgi:tetratricopeptide (TPR) repeat protein